jgi:putative transposase
MPRPLRNTTPGLVRHVIARGNGRMKIFLDDTEFAWFAGLLGEVVEEFAFECWNYCVMPNHYHLTLRPTLSNLSEGMKQLNEDYARWWNRRHQHVGHVFQGPFKDQIVQEDQYCLTLCRYVALNPVRAGLAARPEDWTWSSYAATVGLRPLPEFLTAGPTLRLLGEGDDARLQVRFAEYVAAGISSGGLTNDVRSKQAILGDRAFVVSCTAAASENLGAPAL